jgi:hypothetical protein
MVPSATPLADVLNLRHTDIVKPVIFHPKALAFIRREEPEVRKEIGEALRDLQKEISLTQIIHDA